MPCLLMPLLLLLYSSRLFVYISSSSISLAPQVPISLIPQFNAPTAPALQPLLLASLASPAFMILIVLIVILLIPLVLRCVLGCKLPLKGLTSEDGMAKALLTSGLDRNT